MSIIEYEDKLGAHLREDKRVHQTPVAKKKVFSNPLYEVTFYAYPGIRNEPKFMADLITGLITYKEENLRIMVKLASLDADSDYEKALDSQLKAMQHKGETPLHLVRNAKNWCSVTFTQHDLAFFLQEGIDVHKK